jgi:hypothetical protein
MITLATTNKPSFDEYSNVDFPYDEWLKSAASSFDTIALGSALSIIGVGHIEAIDGGIFNTLIAYRYTTHTYDDKTPIFHF